MARGKQEQAATSDAQSLGVSGVTSETAAPAVAADAPFPVMATMGGTYPDPGHVVARWRNIGDVFLVKCQQDFSNRWMKRLEPGEAAVALIKTQTIPQTTAKARKVSPISPLQ